MAEKLNADAPSWLQGAFFGLLNSSAVAFGVFVLSSAALPETVSYLTPYLAVVAALVSYVAYVAWATPRVTVLRIYSEALAAALDEPIGAARGRVWSMRGPGWKIVGMALWVPLLALAVPMTLLVVASIAVPWNSTGLRSLTPIGWLLVGVSAALIAAVGWLVFRLSKPDETMRLLSQASRDMVQARELVERAVEQTLGVYPRSTASWIGVAALFAWSGAYLYGQITRAFGFGRVPEIVLWVIVSSAVAVVAVKHARRGGAPVAVWTGVALWLLLGTAFGALVYAGAWDAFGTLMTETDGGGWPAPREYVRQVGVHLLANTPLVLSAWVTAIKTKPARAPLA